MRAPITITITRQIWPDYYYYYYWNFEKPITITAQIRHYYYY